MRSVNFFSFSVSVLLIVLLVQEANGAVFGETKRLIDNANKKGPYIGVVIPNLFEMNPLLNYPEYKPSNLIIDVGGRRFRFGSVGNKRLILVMTGLGMLNSGVTTQLLLSLFDIEGVVHYGIAGNANPSLNIGDVVIPHYWAHSALWSWQRYGNGPENTLPLEDQDDYTRDIGYLNIAEYSTNFRSDNFLNNIWYQPEEVFPVDGTPEERQHVFWVPVEDVYFNLAKTLESLELEGCLNETTCLSTPPKVTTVDKGTSASIYLDNAAYRTFIFDKFNVSPVEMESAAVALISYQQRVPFIVIRALSDLAGGGEHSNEADTFINLAANNSVKAAVEFIKLIPSPRKDVSFASI
ncbi:putative adenosylhomocysteine nucleosidase [Helianthus annuus]|uniref:Adenosylhomocysteine nucleosidase n=1 Tax=Helianthus annuus TaxID=4232 RepID=A0A251VS67_HELAN|nr:bark storage protein A [Helianthus annuus]KAF5823912.1 putative adenosylhomocysteine nucleosidase [Helianthus annuus]KAJ0613217.1 putative adenosylhomocysteine nucleosidase [Helianthus annuus]KAJ0624901.1 putative adenosylhomocysteine nucleosidase [Helianthus annuus]KAJ0628572.1 putative adenosylhomocysteine nucleosidase [Helianthus annuus]KAJ0794159.1 putative adenosylhomocysteine nucleosidase [Helianthus annuus]